MAINVIINGANGRMGQVTQTAIAQENDLQLVACTNHGDNLANTITQTNADVVVDFTLPDCVYDNAKIIIDAGARPVIGTSGLTLEQVNSLKQHCADKNRGGIIAPNFSLGAILMMKYAQDAARYLPNVEIVEMHHQHKVDAPSGTAAKTAQMIADTQANSAPTQSPKDPARGDHHHGVPIHSVRLPGYFAHQAVIFGGDGETLTIRHDGMDRTSIMPGVMLACRKVMALDHLVYGLDELLD